MQLWIPGLTLTFVSDVGGYHACPWNGKFAAVSLCNIRYRRQTCSFINNDFVRTLKSLNYIYTVVPTQRLWRTRRVTISANRWWFQCRSFIHLERNSLATHHHFNSTRHDRTADQPLRRFYSKYIAFTILGIRYEYKYSRYLRVPCTSHRFVYFYLDEDSLKCDVIMLITKTKSILKDKKKLASKIVRNHRFRNWVFWQTFEWCLSLETPLMLRVWLYELLDAAEPRGTINGHCRVLLIDKLTSPQIRSRLGYRLDDTAGACELGSGDAASTRFWVVII